MLLGSKLTEGGLVLKFAFGLHNSLCHFRTHINPRTEVLSKYHLVVRKSDTILSELDSVPNAEFTEWVNVCSLTQDNHLGDVTI